MHELPKQWHVIDAEGQVLGRLSTRIATLLLGKHKPTFVPYLDSGDFVVVLNAAKVRVTGKKMIQKKYYRHSGYPGGLAEIPYAKLLAEKPERVVYHAVRGMLPHNRLGERLIKKLHVYKGTEHPHTNVKPLAKVAPDGDAENV